MTKKKLIVIVPHVRSPILIPLIAVNKTPTPNAAMDGAKD
jgi:hypothetical protein